MFWMYPTPKYHQVTYVSYDASQASHFCKPGENWGAFTAAECDSIIALSTLFESRKPTVDGKFQPDKRQVTAWKIDYSQEINWLWERLSNNINYANRQWWNFNIYGILESLHLLCYDANNGDGKYKDGYIRHIDYNQHTHNRKITFSIQLSDPQDYEGGNLKLYASKKPEPLPRSRGTMVMFPSYILHEVAPMVRGKRWALVCWASGPHFR